jgi:geranylgeranyl diphosphate synthase, type II
MPGIDLAFFNRLGFFMGVAFQIQDDLLNLVGEEARCAKEIAGNIWEGKRTVMLINLSSAAPNGRSAELSICSPSHAPRKRRTKSNMFSS